MKKKDLLKKIKYINLFRLLSQVFTYVNRIHIVDMCIYQCACFVSERVSKDLDWTVTCALVLSLEENRKEKEKLCVWVFILQARFESDYLCFSGWLKEAIDLNFPRTSHLWNSVLLTFFPADYNMVVFKSNVNKSLLSPSPLNNSFLPHFHH